MGRPGVNVANFAHIVPATVTHLTALEALGSLLTVMPNLSRQSATLLLALIWVETGRGNVVQHNVGNLTAGASWTGAVWRPPWFELKPDASPRLQTLHALMLQGKAPSAFRAYETSEAGFRDFANVLNRQFPEVLAAATTGSADQLVNALKRRYSADYGKSHVQTFQRLQAEFAPLTAGMPAGTVAPAGANLSALALLFAKHALSKGFFS